MGLHGIDAWRDPVSGRAELEAIRNLRRVRDRRAHAWLYFENDSPLSRESRIFP